MNYPELHEMNTVHHPPGIHDTSESERFIFPLGFSTSRNSAWDNPDDGFAAQYQLWGHDMDCARGLFPSDRLLTA